jgi:phage tail-like protein
VGLIGTVGDLLVGGAGSGLANLLLGQLSGLIRLDRPLTCNFAVRIDGILDTGFMEVSGPSSRITTFKIAQVTEQTDKKLIDKRQEGTITLKQGLSWGGSLERWYNDTINFERGGLDPRRTVSIIQLYKVPSGVPLLGGQLIEMRSTTYGQCSLVDVSFPNYRGTEEAEISVLEVTIDPGELISVTDYGTLLGTAFDAMTP